jgi:DNA-binding NarL/FixJ family response regulator
MGIPEEEQNNIMNNDKKRVFIVDDHPIVRVGLSHLINQDKDFFVCGEADSVHKAIKAIEEIGPDIVIIDVCLKGQSGIELIKNIKGRIPDLPILALSIHDESIYAERVLRAGARGYIMKQEACEKVLTGLRQILDGDIFVSSKVAAKIMNKFIDKKAAQYDSPIDMLSDRELDVFRLIGQGLGTRQIAEELFLGIKTIETHRTRIKQKLKIKTSAELVQYAVRWGQNYLSS